jgi:hypothetical protein
VSSPAAVRRGYETAMALSIFDDKTLPPTREALEAALGRAAGIWFALVANAQRSCGPLSEEWSFAGTAYGWSFRLKQKKRVVVYMTPCRDCFLASFALGEKACAAARTAQLAPSILALIEKAPRYAEGRGVRIPVRRKSDLASVEKLVAIKLGQ